MVEMLAKKNCLILGLEDVLIPGGIDSKVDKKAVHDILSHLQEHSKANPNFRYFLASGYSESIAREKIKQFGLDSFFPKDAIHLVNEEYIASKQDVDRDIYSQKIQENPLFKDEYFKQFAIHAIQLKFKYNPHDMILVGNDLWFEGFYTRRFSKIDVAFIRSAYSELNQKQTKFLDGVIYLDRTWNDIQKLIQGGYPAPNYSKLDDHITKKMAAMLFEGTGMPMVVNLNKKD